MDVEALATGQLIGWLAVAVADALGRPVAEIDVEAPVFDLGLDSAQVVGLAARLSAEVGRELDATFFLRHPTLSAVATAIEQGDPSSQTPRGVVRPPETPIAAEAIEEIFITGMACRFPAARSLERFWDNLLHGIDGVGKWSASRGGMRLPGEAGFIDGIECFDAPFFRIAPAEAAEMDPQQRLLLEVAWEAIEDAGIAAAELKESSVGVFIGASHSEFALERFRHSAPASAVAATGSALSVIANRLSYCLDLNGPSMTVDTACSSSLVALHLACQSLRDGESDVAIVGGVNLLLSPAVTAGLNIAGMLSPSAARCRSFDASADGYVRGEGIGVVVLRRRASSGRGDRRYAKVLSTACNQDGRSGALTAPNPQAQERLLAHALKRAQVASNEVTFVEAHGSATSLGDPIEVSAIRNVYCTGARLGGPLLIGSVKSNLGHLEAASGIAGLIKAALAVHHRMLPKSLHLRTPNPRVPWSAADVQVATANTSLGGQGERIVGAISSFGFGGTNAHVLLRGCDERLATKEEVGAPAGVGAAHWILLSARTGHQLRDMAAKWKAWLTSCAQRPRLVDLSFTTLMKRQRLPVRAAFQVRDHDELLHELRALSEAPVDAFRSVPKQTLFGLFVDGSLASASTRTLDRLPTENVLWRSVFFRVAEEFSASTALNLEHAFRRLRAGGTVNSLEGRVLSFAVTLGLGEMLYASGFRPASVVGRGVGVVCAKCLIRAQSIRGALEIVLSDAARDDDLVDVSMDAGAEQQSKTWVALSTDRGALTGHRIGSTISALDVEGPIELNMHARLVCELARFGFEPPVDAATRSRGRIISLPPYPWNAIHFPVLTDSGRVAAACETLLSAEQEVRASTAYEVPLSGPRAIRALPEALLPAAGELSIAASLERGLKRRQQFQLESTGRKQS